MDISADVQCITNLLAHLLQEQENKYFLNMSKACLKLQKYVVREYIIIHLAQAKSILRT